MQHRSGSVSRLPSGRWSVRVTCTDGKRRRTRETYATEGEARSVAALLVQRFDPRHRTLLAFGETWLDRLELAKARSIDTWRSLWRTWIAGTDLAATTLRGITAAQVRTWVRETWAAEDEVRTLPTRRLGS